MLTGWDLFCAMWGEIGDCELGKALQQMRDAWERVAHYVLDQDGQPVPCSTREWSLWFETTPFEARLVAKTRVGDYVVSTVFIGINYAFDPDRPPEIYETMIFDRDGHGMGEWRYATRGDAWAGHLTAVGYVHSLQGDNTAS